MHDHVFHYANVFMLHYANVIMSPYTMYMYVGKHAWWYKCMY